jgi:hypothetical protein
MPPANAITLHQNNLYPAKPGGFTLRTSGSVYGDGRDQLSE